jgi:V/A-type H+-transporting ATPase subunit I
MAIQQMERLYILGYEENKSEILENLQKRGIVEITDLKYTLEKSKKFSNYVKPADEVATTDYDQKLTTLQYGIDALVPYQPHPSFVVSLIKSLIEGIFGAKLVVTRKKFEEVGKSLDKWLELCNKLRTFEVELSRLRSEGSKIIAIKEQLKPWENLKIKLEEVGESKNAISCLCILLSLKFDSFLQELQKIPTTWLKAINTTGGNHYLFVIVSKSYRQGLEELFRKYEIHIQIFPEDLKGTPKNILKELDSELKKLNSESAKIQKEISKLAKLRYELLIAYDCLLIERNKHAALTNLGRTRNTFIIEGWVKKKDISKLKEALSKYEETEIITRAPLENELPPVCLEEKRIFQPFQLVTNLYGKPAYTEIDPTPFIAPFFLLFFAMCLTDAGYGLVLIALSLYCMKKIRSGRGFFMLMLGCGAVTVVIGALTGSWFGINPLGTTLWIDLLKDPISFLLFALMLGVIQTIYFGPLVKIYKTRGTKKLSATIITELFWALFLTSVMFMLLTQLGFLGATLGRAFRVHTLLGMSYWDFRMYAVQLGRNIQPYILIIIIISAIGAVATKGIGYKKIGKRIGIGLAAIYGVTGYISDILSYSRLLALGMTTSVIALVVNNIAFMALGLPYIGFLFAIIILVGGHAFNLAINALGGFIHTSRLHFVEFFSKFLEGTGKGFEPFSEGKKYTELK